jgi:hypothetical protein
MLQQGVATAGRLQRATPTERRTHVAGGRRVHGQHREAGERGHAAGLQLQGAREGSTCHVQPPQLEGRGADAQPHLRRRPRVQAQRLAEPARQSRGVIA